MKRILYIHQYFKTPKEPGGTRSYWISKKLIDSGYEVIMIAGRSNQEDKVEYEQIDGIDVYYIRNSYDMSFGIFRRALSFIRFMFLSYNVAKKVKSIDIVYATSTPLTVGFPALLLHKIKKIPYIFEVRDLWPEVPIQMGALRNSFVRAIAIAFEKIIYNNAEHVVTLSPGMSAGVIKRGISSSKVSMVPNMAKVQEFYPREQLASSYEKYGIDSSRFNMIHFGSIGLANGVDYIVKAAKELKKLGNDTIQIVFAGGGSQENEMKRLVTEYDLTNVTFLGRFSMQEISELVNLCDCSIVSFANIPILQTNSPNKLFDSLSAGKPIIVNSAGWTKTMVEKMECGAFVDPEFPDQLATLLVEWENESSVVNMMGENSRKLALETYDKSILTEQILTTVKSLLV